MRAKATRVRGTSRYMEDGCQMAGRLGISIVLLISRIKGGDPAFGLKMLVVDCLPTGAIISEVNSTIDLSCSDDRIAGLLGP